MSSSTKHRRTGRWQPGDTRAAVALAQRAREGVIDITEGVRQSVRRTLGLAHGATADRCGGLAGRIYALVRGGHALVGSGAQAALRGLERLRAAEGGGASREAPIDARRLAWLAALNGVCGDHLHATGNALAIEPELGAHDGSLADALAAASASGHLLVLAHGLCMNELQWRSRGDPGHGAALGAALGTVPVYFRYNSGLAIEHSGRLLAEALEAALASMPRPPRRISLIGHSMGGLVARSAERQARQASLRWRGALREIALLGTPNEGAPLERLGHAFERVLGRLPFAHPFTRIGALRSRGILDLRDGLHDAEGLPEDLRCYAVAASLARTPGRLDTALLGDGLVPVESALGRRALGRPADDALVVPGTGHLQLLRSLAVRRQLSDWLAAD